MKATILNARRGAVINIKPLDTKRGKSRDPEACAAARACVRDLRATAARVHVGRTYIRLPRDIARKYAKVNKDAPPNVWVRFRTPTAIRTEVVGFDRTHSFQPGEYTLPALQPSHHARGKRMGGKTTIKAKGKRKTNHRPTPRHTLVGVRTFKPVELNA